jgi:hypothetical protein
MDKSKAIEILRKEMQQINVLQSMLDNLEADEQKGYDAASGRRINAIADLFVVAHESTISDFYKIKDGI